MKRQMRMISNYAFVNKTKIPKHRAMRTGSKRANQNFDNIDVNLNCYVPELNTRLTAYHYRPKDSR